MLDVLLTGTLDLFTWTKQTFVQLHDSDEIKFVTWITLCNRIIIFELYLDLLKVILLKLVSGILALFFTCIH